MCAVWFIDVVVDPLVLGEHLGLEERIDELAVEVFIALPSVE